MDIIGDVEYDPSRDLLELFSSFSEEEKIEKKPLGIHINEDFAFNFSSEITFTNIEDVVFEYEIDDLDENLEDIDNNRIIITSGYASDKLAKEVSILKKYIFNFREKSKLETKKYSLFEDEEETSEFKSMSNKKIDLYPIYRKLSNPFEDIGNNLIVSKDKREGKSNIPFYKLTNNRINYINLKISPDGFEPKIPFINRASIKLSNIDYIFGLTGPRGTYNGFKRRAPFRSGLPGYEDREERLLGLESQQNLWRKEIFSTDNFSFCDIAAGPGGFTGYIQYRRPDNIGFGISLEKDDNEQFHWYRDYVDSNNFFIFDEEPTDPSQDKGDIFVFYQEFINSVLSESINFSVDNDSNGVDLVTGDGCVETPDLKECKDKLKSRNNLNTKLFLYQAYISLMTVKENGIICLKIFDTFDQVSVELMFLVAACFKEFYIFKPVTSRPSNKERYVIGKYKNNKNLKKVLKVMRKIIKIYNNNGGDTVVTSILKYDMPKKFLKYIRKINNFTHRDQIEEFNNIKYLIENFESLDDINKNYVPAKKYSIEKALVLWNLPGNW